MKTIICILLSLVTITNSFSQNSNDSVFHLDSISLQGIVLDKGWKFQAGDELKWAQPEFNDGSWETIDPTSDIHTIPQLQNNMAWLRLRFSVDTNLLQYQLALIIQQSVASEIYLNGKLIHRFGQISSEAAKIEPFDPLWQPVSFPLTIAPMHVLAIRMAIKPGIRYTTLFETYNPVVSITVNKLEKAIPFYTSLRVTLERFEVFLMGISVMLFILHFAFFLVYRSRKPSLYLAGFALVYLAGNVIQLNFFILEHDVSNRFLLGNLSFALFLIAEFNLMLAIYSLFERKKDLVFWIGVFYIIPALILNAFPYGWGWRLGGPILEIFFHLAIIRVASMAVFKRKRSSLIIAAGGVASLIFFILFISQGTFYNNSFVGSLTGKRMFCYIMFQLSIPIATSIYLGLDFAYINRALAQKLSEVESLSQRNIAHEQEKQQILSTQNETLEKQVHERTEALTRSLENLQTTQSQLIQSEKMASLGELTAGIAHEIQNPLNFINNFSEVNTELIAEMKEEIDKGNIEEIKAISHDLEENEQKINHHGKRADAIVKGMLQHSRVSTGQKELTDINSLADEYLRLSYHGFRAKDKAFNATLQTNFDESISKISIVPQDIGRVLLNLFSNAFYAVNEKKRLHTNGYEPLITVSTKKENNKAIIVVRDNGIGVPQKVADKIFQPFFTTKPTGQGTGLGLSLSYDIIKAHNGKLEVKSDEGRSTEFIITLPEE